MACDKQRTCPGISAPDSAIVKDVPAIPAMANNE